MTPNRESVDARFIDPDAYFDGLHPPGTFTIRERDGKAILYATLPGGHLAMCTLKPGYPNGWEKRGTDEKPTLHPSILCRGGPDLKQERWHGWLREGRFVSV